MSRESRFAALVIAGLAFVSTAPAFAWTPTVGGPRPVGEPGQRDLHAAPGYRHFIFSREDAITERVTDVRLQSCGG